MKPTVIRDIKDLVVNVDSVDLAETYAKRLRGVILDQPGNIRRDLGSKELYATANYPSGTLIDQFPLYDPTTGYTHRVVVVVDSNTKTRIYVDTSTTGAGTFTELTKYYTATLSATPSASAQSCSISGLSEAVAIHALQEYIAVNNTRKTAEIAISAIANNGSGLIRVTIPSGHGLTTNHRVMVKDVEGLPGANNVWALSNIASTTVDLVGSTYAAGYTSGTGKISGLGFAVIIEDNDASVAGASAFTSANILGSNGLNWISGDTVTIYKSIGAYLHTYSNGATPQLNFLPLEAQRKLTLLLGNSDTIPTMNYPVSIQKRDARNYFDGTLVAGMAALKSLSAGWYLERRGGLCPSFTQVGKISTSLTSYVQPSTPRTVLVADDDPTEPWMKVTVTPADHADGVAHTGHKTRLYIYVTAKYDYQESDPILQAICASSTDDFLAIDVALRFYVNLARLDKEITGFRVYAAALLTAELDAGQEKTLSDKDYKFIEEIKVQGAVDTTTTAVDWDSNNDIGGFNYQYIATGNITTDKALNSRGGNSILDNLGRAILKTRTRIKPRYGVRLARAQGAYNVVDEDDRTLRISAYGNGVHMDDVFPNLETDRGGARLKINLNGRGELMGLGAQSGNVIAFRRSPEAEVYDLASDSPRIVYADVASKKGIIVTPQGTMVAGHNGIYLFPNGWQEAFLINPRWLNRLDGTEKLPGTTTPYVTSAYRSTIVAGYEPVRKEAMFQIKMNKEGGGTEFVTMIYKLNDPAFPNSGTWRERVFPTEIKAMNKWFDQSPDGTMCLTTASKMLQYPNVNGTTLIYEDEVTSADVSAGFGVDFDLWLHIGSYYNFIDGNVLFGLQLDHVGERKSGAVDADCLVSILLYKNRETTAFDTKGQIIDDRCEIRRVQRAGIIRDLSLRILLPSAKITNFKKFDISTLYLLGEPKERVK